LKKLDRRLTKVKAKNQAKYTSMQFVMLVSLVDKKHRKNSILVAKERSTYKILDKKPKSEN
jgi:hypothetical protein